MYLQTQTSVRCPWTGSGCRASELTASTSYTDSVEVAGNPLTPPTPAPLAATSNNTRSPPNQPPQQQQLASVCEPLLP